MRIPLLVIVGALLLGSWAERFASDAAKSSTKPPNIVFILADDLGYGELGCYGQEKIRTPHLDRLAKEGMRFTQHYAGNNVCAPSRCSLLTGRHPGNAFIRDNREVRPEGQLPLPAATVTLSGQLKRAGYRTACVGKWGLGVPGSTGDPLKHGFDLFFGYHCQRHAHSYYPSYLRRNDQRIELNGETYTQDLLDAEALRFLDSVGQEPFFLFVPALIPHLALQIPEKELAEYRGQWDDPPYDGKRGYVPHPTPRAAYAAMISRLDRAVGQIVKKLEERNLTEHTLLLFSSDNGATHDVGGADTVFFESTAGLRGRKGSMYEGGLRVPLIAYWPDRIKAGTVAEFPCAAWDLMPTILELAGQTIPPGDGVSLVPTLLDTGRQQEHQYLYWESPGYGGQQAVRWDRWKAVRKEINRGNMAIELYDLATDPNESRELAAERPALVKRAEELMKLAHQPSQEFPLFPTERGRSE